MSNPFFFLIHKDSLFWGDSNLVSAFVSCDHSPLYLSVQPGSREAYTEH